MLKTVHGTFPEAIGKTAFICGVRLLFCFSALVSETDMRCTQAYYFAQKPPSPCATFTQD